MSHARRDEILTRYGPPGTHPDFEIDHLIPLCFGGSDDPSNLWPEPRRRIEPKWKSASAPDIDTKATESTPTRPAKKSRIIEISKPMMTGKVPPNTNSLLGCAGAQTP
jgi:hypothetical protein